MGKKLNNDHRYDDIIGLPHHVSPTRPRMRMADRAAQFSPFAALTGYEAAIREARRLTDRRIELDEYEKAALDGRLNLILERLKLRPEVTVTYFQPDARKSGGAYRVFTGRVKKIDRLSRALVFSDGTAVSIDDIVELDGNMFNEL